MGFFSWLTTNRGEDKIIKKSYNMGLKEGYNLGHRAGLKEGEKRGWKEAMSTIANIADEMTIKKH